MFVLISCQFGDTRSKDYPYELLLEASDLPSGYVYSDSDFPDIDGGKSIEVLFKRNTGELGTSIIHQIYIYPDTSSAIDAYVSLEEKLFFDEWAKNDDLDYQPTDRKDKVNISCIPLSVSDRVSKQCILLQQHNNTVFKISVSINEMNITFSEFDEILQTADGKLSNEMVKMPLN